MIAVTEANNWIKLPLCEGQYTGSKTENGGTAIVQSVIHNAFVDKNETWDAVYGYIYRSTVIVVGVSVERITAFVFTDKGVLEGVVTTKGEINTPLDYTEITLGIIKRRLLAEMWKIVKMKSRRRSALISALETIKDDHVTQYFLGNGYKLVKHKGRTRLYHHNVIASDFSNLSELTKTHLCMDKRIFG